MKKAFFIGAVLALGACTTAPATSTGSTSAVPAIAACTASTQAIDAATIHGWATDPTKRGYVDAVIAAAAPICGANKPPALPGQIVALNAAVAALNALAAPTAAPTKGNAP